MTRCSNCNYWQGVWRARLACWQPIVRERDTQRSRRRAQA